MNARFQPITVGKVAPAPTRIPAPYPQTLDDARAKPDYTAMDDVADYAQTLRKPVPADRDDVFSEPDDLEPITDAEHLIDVQSDMRDAWERARFWAGSLNPPKLPIVEGGKLILLSFPEVLALCGETNHLYVMLADVFRGASPDALQHHLRQTWIDGYAQELAAMGWSA